VIGRRIAIVLLAAAAWLASICAVYQPCLSAPLGRTAMPSLGAVEISQIEAQARALCARHYDTSHPIVLPDGALTCAPRRRAGEQSPNDHARPERHSL
jgi:hypothetical protein